jgi:hypothetical protein
MELLATRPNPKALNLDGLSEISKKVTVGFKCDPKVKLRLAQEAGKIGLTLSEYVENLLLALDSKSEQKDREIEVIKDQLAFYENSILLDFFEKHKGQEVSFTDSDGNFLKLKVKEPKDIYTLIIHSFRASK